MAECYSSKSISNFSKDNYLSFLKSFLRLAIAHSEPTTRLAFLNSDWRNFQGIAAIEENANKGILISDYINILSDAGWQIT